MEHQLWFFVAVGLIAFVYSLVGHGGASGYLALLSFTALPTKTCSTTALILNLVVSSVTFLSFRRAKHFDWQIAWPFLLGSIPFAFLGGSLKMEGRIQDILLGATLLYASVLLIVGMPKSGEDDFQPKRWVCILAGAGIGLLSGIVGVGGGIFLSPLLILTGWAKPHQAASIASIFILANSAAGLAARPPTALQSTLGLWPLVIFGFVGAVAGSWIGATKTSPPGMRRALGVVLLIAVVKLIFK